MDDQLKGNQKIESVTNLTVVATQDVQQEEIKKLVSQLEEKGGIDELIYSKLLEGGLDITREVTNARNLLFEYIDLIQKPSISDTELLDLKNKAMLIAPYIITGEISDIQKIAYEILNILVGQRVVGILEEAIKLQRKIILTNNSMYSDLIGSEGVSPVIREVQGFYVDSEMVGEIKDPNKLAIKALEPSAIINLEFDLDDKSQITLALHTYSVVRRNFAQYGMLVQFDFDDESTEDRFEGEIMIEQIGDNIKGVYKTKEVSIDFTKVFGNINYDLRSLIVGELLRTIAGNGFRGGSFVGNKLLISFIPGDYSTGENGVERAYEEWFDELLKVLNSFMQQKDNNINIYSFVELKRKILVLYEEDISLRLSPDYKVVSTNEIHDTAVDVVDKIAKFLQKS